MTTKVTATTLKSKLLALLDDVEKGEEIEVTRHGRTIARVVPARGGRAILGKFAGMAKTVHDGDDLLSTGAEWTYDADNIGR